MITTVQAHTNNIYNLCDSVNHIKRHHKYQYYVIKSNELIFLITPHSHKVQFK